MYLSSRSSSGVNNNVQKLRKDQKMTQEQLAAKLDVTRQTIISIEKGKYTPSLPLALKMSVVFKKDVEEIFSL